MKRKLTTLIMLAIALVSMNVFTSCKDYDEDQYNELRKLIGDQNTTLKAYIDGQVKNLQDQIDQLKAAQGQIAECSCGNIDQKIKDAIDAYAKNHKDMTEQDVIDLIKKYATVENGGLTEEQVKGLISAAINEHMAQCKCEEAIAKLQLAIDAANGRIDGVDGRVDNAVARILALESLAAEAKNLAQQAYDYAERNGKKIEALESVVKEINETLTSIKSEIITVRNEASQALAQAQANKQEIEKIWQAIQTLDPNMPNLSEFVTMYDVENFVNSTLNDYYTKADIYNILVEYYTKYEIDEMLKNYVTSSESEVKAQQILTQAKEYTDQEIAKVGETIADLDKAYKDADKALQDQIDALDTKVKELSDAVDEVKSDLTELSSLVEKVKNSLANLVTDMIIQGTDNPVFGSFALPANVNSNVLIAYYGVALNGIEFPTEDAGYYAWTGQALTAAEAEMIGSSVMGSFSRPSNYPICNNNAGTLYLTVNPAEVDFTGVQLTLENSQEKSAGITLEPLQKSDKTLTFGYTRANNGFYEAKATVLPSDIASGKVQTINLDLKGFKDIAQDLLSREDGFSVTNAATTIYNQFDGVLDANAVKATYTDEVGTTRSIYSNYSIAATAITPLSYKFAQEYYGKETLPGYERLEAALLKITDKASETMKTQLAKFAPKVVNKFKGVLPKIKEITYELPTVDDCYYMYTKMENSIVLEDKTYELRQMSSDPTDTWLVNVDDASDMIECNVDGDAWRIQSDGSIAVRSTFTPAEAVELARLFGKTGNVVDNINDMAKDIQKAVDDLNDLLKDYDKVYAYIDKAHNKANSMLLSILDKANKTLVGYVNRAISMIQPCAVVSDKNHSYLGRNSKHNPIMVEGNDITVYCTSYTAETFTPAYQKHLACVDVIDGSNSAQGGDSSLKAKLDAVNGQSNMNTVVDGETTAFDINLESGVTYKFAYSAVDYHGLICTKRFTVRVK